MIKNYLKIAVRHLFRHPAYSLLNILGLTIGLASSMLILLYLVNELSYDSHHEKADRIFRISSDITEPDDNFRWSVTQQPLAMTLKADYPEVEEYVRFIGNGRTRLELDGKNFFEDDVFFVDSTIFDIFTFNFIKGDPASALDKPNAMVINKSIADKLFADQNPIGQTLKSDGDLTFEVTGVIEDMPSNSHIIARALISTQTVPGMMNPGPGSWGGFGIYSYVLLNENADPKAFEAKLPEVITKHVEPIFSDYGITVKYELWPIKDIHLKSTFEGEPESLGDIRYIYIFSAVGLFLLLIACINYMNLSTARSSSRSLEVGMRKVLGAERGWLMTQFLSESMLLTLIAFGASLLLLWGVVPLINSSLGLNLQFAALGTGNVLWILMGIMLITGILGGSYPAFYLSSFQPVFAIKGVHVGKSGAKIFRKVLVVMQFAISMFMFAGTTIIYNQMQYVQDKDLGFDKEQIVRFNLNNRELREKWPVLRDKFLESPDINRLGTASTSPGYGFSKRLFSLETKEGVMEQKGVDNYRVDFDYFPTLDMKIVAGRNFSQEFGSDSSAAVIVNEAMVKRMSWTNPIGKKVRFGVADTLPTSTVIGVVKDFHQQALYNPIEPLMFIPNFNNGVVMVKAEGDIEKTVGYMKSTWEEVFPTIPFEYTFLDERFWDQYETDRLRGRLFLGFTLMTIIIACLGLLGLASYTAEQRSKEISIRKVLGARTSGLISLLVKEFALLIGIAALPAFGFAWYFMTDWLKSFEYHGTISLMVFVLVLLATLAVTVLATGYHAYKAATANPVENLKYE